MRRVRGLVLAGVLVVALEAGAGAVGLALLGPVEIALFLVACAAATAGVTALAACLIVVRGRGDDGDDGWGGGGDGEDPEPPSWWPGFERDFRRYARERERDRRHAPA